MFNSWGQVIEQVTQLPMLPQSTIQVLEMINGPDSTPEDIDQMINGQPKLAAAVLRLAESSSATEINSISKATVSLGFTALRSLVMAAALDVFFGEDFDSAHPTVRDVWRHSMVAAAAARILALSSGATDAAANAFIGGLLHDCGKIILFSRDYGQYQKILDSAHKGQEPLTVVEQRLLGFDHAQVGALVAGHWQLSADVVNAIRCHHSLNPTKQYKLSASLVHLADVVSLMTGVGSENSDYIFSVDVDALAAVGISQRQMEEVTRRIKGSFIRNNALFLQN